MNWVFFKICFGIKKRRKENGLYIYIYLVLYLLYLFVFFFFLKNKNIISSQLMREIDYFVHF
jgi:hypothetical protein